jgi:hypothetical protein
VHELEVDERRPLRRAVLALLFEKQVLEPEVAVRDGCVVNWNWHVCAGRTIPHGEELVLVGNEPGKEVFDVGRQLDRKDRQRLEEGRVDHSD